MIISLRDITDAVAVLTELRDADYIGISPRQFVAMQQRARSALLHINGDLAAIPVSIPEIK